MEQISYELKPNLKVTQYYTDVDIYVYLEDKNGKQLGKLTLFEDVQLSDLKEGGDRGSTERSTT